MEKLIINQTFLILFIYKNTMFLKNLKSMNNLINTLIYFINQLVSLQILIFL
jgi:hypothetical protein